MTERPISYLELAEGLYMIDTYGKQSYDGLRQVFQRVKGESLKSLNSLQDTPAVVLVCDMPVLHLKKLSPQNINICFTTFETSRLPQSWTDALNGYYDYCVVPHESVKRTFIESGVTIPVFVVHQGYARRERNSSIPQDVFRVGFLGVPQKRKNLDLLFEACSALREHIPKLTLAVHAATLYDEISKGRLKSIMQCPWVEWTEGIWNEEQIAGWYSKLSCYVFPSSGEGWSFTPRESLYMGIPTVVSDIPVHQELAKSGYCVVVPTYDICPAVHETIKEGKIGHSAYGEWAKLEVRHIAESILNTYQNFELETKRAKAGSDWVARQWQNQESNKTLFALLQEIKTNNNKRSYKFETS